MTLLDTHVDGWHCLSLDLLSALSSPSLLRTAGLIFLHCLPYGHPSTHPCCFTSDGTSDLCLWSIFVFLIQRVVIWPSDAICFMMLVFNNQNHSLECICRSKENHKARTAAVLLKQKQTRNQAPCWGFTIYRSLSRSLCYQEEISAVYTLVISGFIWKKQKQKT